MAKIRNGLVVMTALPPTVGHKYLIDFAAEYMKNECPDGMLSILVCSRDGIEPFDGKDRFYSLWVDCGMHHKNVDIRLFDDKDAPQVPKDHPDFWNWWKEVILARIPNIQGGIVFASDLYGKNLARAIGCEFIPCNTYREIIDISATKIRNDPINNFHFILPDFQNYLKKTITLFGAESTGKTTFSKLLARNYNGYWVPEWAREYMEVMYLCVVDDALMDHIIKAQYASQVCVSNMKDKPFIFQDTDLLSSIGYYHIAGLDLPSLAKTLFRETKSDLYILMNDKIPFTPDPLRLGGSIRESDNTFWINLLKEYDCNYYEVVSQYKEDQEQEISTVVRDFFMKNSLFGFKRSI